MRWRLATLPKMCTPALNGVTATQMLLDWSKGDQAALDLLMPLVDRELHRLAHHYMRRETPGHTLQTTALVNEAYLRLIDQKNPHCKNRAHFFALAAKFMRRILVDHARRRLYGKRGGGARRITFDETKIAPHESTPSLIELDYALNNLARLDKRKSRVVELRFFGGLTFDETAEALNVSTATVKRDWRLAKAWLYDSLKT